MKLLTYRYKDYANFFFCSFDCEKFFLKDLHLLCTGTNNMESTVGTVQYRTDV